MESVNGSVLRTEVLFENDYICTSSTDNEINLEIPLDTLSRALKSCSTSTETTIRLTKKSNNAYLALTTSITVPPTIPFPSSISPCAGTNSLKGKTGMENEITHLVPTKVLQGVDEREPNLPEEEVHIMLPFPIETLRGVSERYKSLSDKLILGANMAGELKLRVEADEVKVETKWQGLVNPPLGIRPHLPWFRGKLFLLFL